MEGLRPNTEVLMDLGIASFNLKEWKQAAQYFQRANGADPDNVEAMHWLAWTLVQLNGDLDRAEMLFRRALKLGGDDARIRGRLAWVLHNLRKMDEAEEHARAAADAMSDNFEAIFILAKIHQVQGRYTEAAAEYETALQLKPGSPLAEFYSGLIALVGGRHDIGWERYEARIQLFGLEIEDLPFPVWQGESDSGLTLLVRSEQGLGDLVWAGRYFKMIKERVGRLIVSCPVELHRLLEASGPIDGVVEGTPPDMVEHIGQGAQIYAMSLPRVFRTTLDRVPADTPYLKPAKASVDLWAGRLATVKRPRVGIVWSGNPKQQNNDNRSFKLIDMAPLTQAGPISYLSLQKGEPQVQLGGELPFPVLDLGTHLNDFEDTAAALLSLDALVTVDTSVLHLAGALNRPVYALPPFIDDWRWAPERTTTPYYPSVRLFRQPTSGDWTGALSAVAAALKKDLFK